MKTSIETEKLDLLFNQIETAVLTFRSFADTVVQNYSKDDGLIEDLEILNKDIEALWVYPFIWKNKE